MSVHTNPRQCLKNLIQQQTDGGRTEYLQQEWRSTETKPANANGRLRCCSVSTRRLPAHDGTIVQGGAI